MTARETNLLNAFETTLTGTIGASDSTMTVNAVVDSAGNQIQPDSYLVLNPDSATNREVVLISAVNASSKQLTIGDGGSGFRYLTGSAATSGLSHASGSVVRMAPLQQHIEDINDRVDTIINEAGTAVNTSLFLDEDDMSSNSATKGVTQQSVKAYVDTQLTAEDLDVTADSGGPISIDLDSATLDLEGGTGIDTTASTDKVTFAIDSTVATLTGSQALTNKTIDVDSNTVSNIEVDNLKSGVLDTDLSSVSGSDDTLASAKAIKTYVDTQITAEDLDLADGDGNTGAVDLDSQSLTLQGTSNEVEVALSGQTFTIGLPSSITANLVGNVTGNVSGSSGSTTGNAATATALETARTIGGVSFDGTANINLPGVNTAGTQNTSGTAAGLSATLAVASGGTGATSMTDKAVVITQDSGTDTLSSVAMDANGELLIGGTSGPAVGTLTAGTGVTITNGDGSITISAPDVGDVTASSTTTFTNKTIDADATGNSITNIEDANIKSAAAIDASKIADGSVSNAEFQRLDGVTSDIQTQLDAKGDVTASSTTTFTNKTIDADGTGNSITNIEDANIKASAAIDAAKIADGSVSNAEFQRLDGVTSDIQTQLDAKGVGDITAVNTAANSGLAGGAASGDASITVDPSNLADGSSVTVDTANDLLILEDVTDGTVYKVKPNQIASGSANALVDGDSDFTITDGVANGIHYELDNTDMADWNQGGIALTTAGGIFRHHQTQAATYTVAANEGAVLAGPITITGTVTNSGTMVVI